MDFDFEDGGGDRFEAEDDGGAEIASDLLGGAAATPSGADGASVYSHEFSVPPDGVYCEFSAFEPPPRAREGLLALTEEEESLPPAAAAGDGGETASAAAPASAASTALDATPAAACALPASPFASQSVLRSIRASQRKTRLENATAILCAAAADGAEGALALRDAPAVAVADDGAGAGVVAGLSGRGDAHLSFPPPIPDPAVQNVVASADLKTTLDLRAISISARNVEYDPRRLNAAVVRLRRPRATALAFRSGRLMVCGARSEDEAHVAAKKVAKLIKVIAHPELRFCGFSVDSVIGSADCGFPVRLEGLAYDHHLFCTYEPEIFSGLVYKYDLSLLSMGLGSVSGGSTSGGSSAGGSSAGTAPSAAGSVAGTPAAAAHGSASPASAASPATDLFESGSARSLAGPGPIVLSRGGGAAAAAATAAARSGSAVLLIFVSGKVVITGCRCSKDVRRVFRSIFPVLMQYRK